MIKKRDALTDVILSYEVLQTGQNSTLGREFSLYSNEIIDPDLKKTVTRCTSSKHPKLQEELNNKRIHCKTEIPSSTQYQTTRIMLFNNARGFSFPHSCVSTCTIHPVSDLTSCHLKFRRHNLFKSGTDYTKI